MLRRKRRQSYLLKGSSRFKKLGICRSRFWCDGFDLRNNECCFLRQEARKYSESVVLLMLKNVLKIINHRRPLVTSVGADKPWCMLTGVVSARASVFGYCCQQPSQGIHESRREMSAQPLSNRSHSRSALYKESG